MRKLVDEKYLGTSFALRGNALSILMDHIPGMREYLDAFWPNRGLPRHQKRQFLPYGTIHRSIEQFLTFHEQSWKVYTLYPSILDTVVHSEEEQQRVLKNVSLKSGVTKTKVLFRFVEKT